MPFLHTLGRFVLTEGQDGAPLMQRGKPLALLAYCLAERRRTHTRDALSLLLWADTPPERARHNVRQALWRLRRVIGDRSLSGGDTVSGVTPDLVSDRDLFLEAEARGDVDAALMLYHGPFLQGVSLPGADEFEDWASQERLRLEKSLIRLVERSIGANPQDYGAGVVRQTAVRLVEQAPDSLEARRVAVDLLLAAGDRAAARREADTLESIALAQHHTMPAAIHSAIQRTRVMEPEADNPADSPATISLKLVGREQAVALAMKEWLMAREGECRALVFEGVAGVGKSRLLQVVADQCRRRRGHAVMIGANAGERQLPYSFAALLVRELATLPGALGVSSASARELVRLHPALASQFFVDEAASTKPDAEDGIRLRALAVVDLVQAVTEQVALVLIIDDGHWIDDPSRQLLTMVLARVGRVPLFVVAGSRPGANALAVDGALRHPLLPLEPTDLVVAIRGSGTWPNTPAADDFVERVARNCDGLPLNVVERLSLALESGAVQRHEGEWSSQDWHAAGQDDFFDSPLSRRIAACSAEEQELLRVLAVAGTPLSGTVLVPAVTSSALLASLEGKGFLRCEQASWTPTHDLIVETVLTRADQAARAHAHRILATALNRSADDEGLAASVRHWLLAGDVKSAGASFRRLLGKARARRDPRSARQLLDDLVGAIPAEQASKIVESVPWFRRDPSLKLRGMVALSILLTVWSMGFAWHAATRPSLEFEQTPLASTEAKSFGDHVIRLVPSPVIRINGPRSSRARRQLVVVRPMDSSTRIVAGDSVLSDGGLARFGGLRLLTSDSMVRLRFESAEVSPLTTTVRLSKYGTSRENDGSLRLLDGSIRVAGSVRRIRGDSVTLRAAVGDTIDGVIQVAYSAPWAAASVWVAFTPSWGDPQRSGADLQPITTPVQWEVIDLRIRTIAPLAPGSYWMIIVAGAEPSGGFLLSNTNWSVGRPIWGDGNDIAAMPDTVIERARSRGLLPVRIAYPDSTQPECPMGSNRQWRYCDAPRGFVAIKLIVR